MLAMGEMAANFQAPALLPQQVLSDEFDFFEYTKGKKALLFFYPLDFTFVCPSELWSLNERCPDFFAMNTVPLAISIDSVYTHLAWQRTPLASGGLEGMGPIQFPMISDIKQDICRLYGVQHGEGGVALRASVLVDENRLIRHISINDLPLGRNIDELHRLVQALSHHQAHGEVCPAQWRAGMPAMQPSPQGVADYLAHRKPGPSHA